jgi:hypothetical protein
MKALPMGGRMTVTGVPRQQAARNDLIKKIDRIGKLAAANHQGKVPVKFIQRNSRGGGIEVFKVRAGE